MYQGKAKNKLITVSDLPTGLYILKVEADNKFYTFKIIKE